MANELQERYSNLVDKKLRDELVTKDGVIFNNKYEGNPKAGVVKIPSRDTEVAIGDYNKTNGVSLTESATTYIDLALDNDKAVNELIDGFDAQAVPDNIVADRLESASYSLALQIDKDSIGALEGLTGATKVTKDAPTTTPYKDLMDARVEMSKVGVPKDRRYAIVSPEFLAILMQDNNFIREGDLSQELLMTGAVGKCGGFAIYECNHLGEKTDFICGHPDFCHRVMEWQVPVHLQDLNGSGKYIGASAVQGRKIYGIKVPKEKTVVIQVNA